jgi:long-chain acyl-CoA synthetase
MTSSSVVNKPSSVTTADTFPAAFRATADRVPDRVAIRSSDGGIELTYARLRKRADAIAGGFASLGLTRGDTVALMMGARTEFQLTDLALQQLGVTAFSIYLTSSPDQIQYLLTDAGARMAVVDPAFADNFFSAAGRVPGLEKIVTLEPDGRGDLSLSEVEVLDPSFDPTTTITQIRPDDIATIIYTSGTTGPAKGVELTHANLLACVEAWRSHLSLPDGARLISWLPNAHIAERMAHYYNPFTLGGTVTTLADPKQIAGALASVRPTWFFAPPRLWEKLQAMILAKLAAQPEEARAKAEAAIEAAIMRVRLLQDGAPVPQELEAGVAAADKLLFAPIRAQLGLDEAVATVPAAAAVPLGLLEFFTALGLPFYEGWGMSETAGSGTLCRSGAVRLGTVGRPMPGTELTLAADGEILVRGPVIMRGYRNKPEQTAEAIDSAGWLHTGDLGAHDAHGFLKIIGRKKEIMINSAGKNMAPNAIESTLKGASPLIAQCMVIGESRPYVTALIVLDPEYAAVWAAQQGLESAKLETLATDEQVLAEVRNAVDAANKTLSRVEQVKYFHVVGGDWLPDSAELTPTMKLKREAIEDKYAPEIDNMYSRENPLPSVSI